MLSPVERVLILRSAELFHGTPDAILAEVADLAEEVHLYAGQTVIRKGDTGDSMYLIASGELRVHDGDHTINFVHHPEIFGEMALLDAQPRMASITATTESVLLRLDQEPFFELLDDRSEVARGIIRTLSRRLRDTVAGKSAAPQPEQQVG